METMGSPGRDGADAGSGTVRWTLERIRREYILETVRHTRGSTTDAARILGIDRRTLASRLRRYLSDAPRDGHAGPR